MSLIAFEPETQETPLGGNKNRFLATIETADERSSGTIKRVLDNLDPNLTRVFLPWALRHPKYLGALGRLARAHKKSAKARLENREQGLFVPPFLIISITPRCNLRCAGCYAAAAGTVSKHCGASSQPLDLEQWQKMYFWGRSRFLPDLALFT